MVALAACNVRLIAAEGDILWQFGADSSSFTEHNNRIGVLKATVPAIGTDGSVYIMSDDGRVRALDPTPSANVKWKSNMPGFTLDSGFHRWEPPCSPAVDAAGTVWVGGRDPSVPNWALFALNPSNGNVTWSYVFALTNNAGEPIGAPAVDVNQFVYGIFENRIVAVAPSNSTYSVRWTYANEITNSTTYLTTRSVALSEDWVSSGTTNQYLVFGEKEFLASTLVGGRVHALLVQSSSSTAGYTDSWTWSFPLTDEYPITAPSLGADGTIYIGSNSNRLYALDLTNSTTRVKWTNDLGAQMSPVVIGADHTLYLGTASSNILALNPATGASLWSTNVGGAVASAPVVGTDGALYVATMNGKFLCLSADQYTTNRVLWTNITSGAVESPSMAMDDSGRLFALRTGMHTNQVIALQGFGRPGTTPWPMYSRNSKRTGKYRPPYAVTDLGTIPGGTVWAGFSPYWINQGGAIAGYGTDDYNNLLKGSTWTSGSGVVDAGNLSSSFPHDALTSINISGTQTGYAEMTSGYTSAFRRSSAGTWTQLGPLHQFTTPAYSGFAEAECINSDDLVVGKSANSNSVYRATLWDTSSTNAINLQSLVLNDDTAFSAATWINNGGYIVGYSVTDFSGAPYHGYFIPPNETISGQYDIGTINGNSNKWSAALSVNEAGIIAGYGDRGDGKTRAFFKLPSSVSPVITHTINQDFRVCGVEEGAFMAWLNAINNQRQATGYRYGAGIPGRGMIVPLHLNRMSDLNPLIAANSGWVLGDATHLNDLGQIVGLGAIGGYSRGYLLTPQD